jgi:dolichol-phosphate mannosyltransferase
LDDALHISLIVPTLNEAANLAPLAGRVQQALAGRAYELLIVDDNSRDNTIDVCQALSQQFPLRLITRKTPADGLSGAVLAGLREARGRVLVVMDGDLQHPPEKLPELVAPIEDNTADFVIGSRYTTGGSIETGWTFYRAINSRIATVLARPFSGKISDPMSGFFALRRDNFLNARHLTPLGYKIALELICKTRAKRVLEVPIHFARRAAGESKLSLKEQFRYLEHLSRLYDFTYPRLIPVLKFLFVMLGWAIGLGFFALLPREWNVITAVLVSYGWVIAVTAVFHGRYVRTQHAFLTRPHPWRDFILSSLAELSACAVATVYLLHRTHVPAFEIAIVAFIAALGARYILRKELLLDIRGLRHEIRKDEMQP